jgi:hypothetical protein
MGTSSPDSITNTGVYFRKEYEVAVDKMDVPSCLHGRDIYEELRERIVRDVEPPR